MKIGQYEKATNQKLLDKELRPIDDGDFTFEPMAAVLLPPSPVPAFEGMRTMHIIIVKALKTGLIKYVNKNGYGKKVKLLTDKPFRGVYGKSVDFKKEPIAVIDGSKTLTLKSGIRDTVTVFIDDEEVDRITVWDLLDERRLYDAAAKILVEIDKAFKADIRQQIKFMKGTEVGTEVEEDYDTPRRTYRIFISDVEVKRMTEVAKYGSKRMFILASIHCGASKDIKPYLEGVDMYSFVGNDYTYVHGITYFETEAEHSYQGRNPYRSAYEYKLLWYIAENVIIVKDEDFIEV